MHELSNEQRQAFFQDGFVRLPGVVPDEMVHGALAAINGSLGTQGIDWHQHAGKGTAPYCPGLGREPVITDLYNASPVREYAESAIGRDKVLPVTGAQIALRFPSPGPERAPVPHLDGMHTPTNGVPAGTIGNFTMLVGVFLSEVPKPFCGNFSVWPGTHHQYETYFREHGPQSLLDSMPPIELPEPHQVVAKPGDAVLVHYQLAHAAALNTASPHIRYALFFRLTHVDHEAQKWEAMTDIWREYDGIRGVAAARDLGS
jgi:hypothetical protein